MRRLRERIAAVAVMGVTTATFAAAPPLGPEEQGSFAAWGSNLYGQAVAPDGIGTTANPITAVDASNHTIVLLADGSVACWGANYYGQCDVPSGLTSGNTTTPVVDIATGRDHNAVVLQDGTVAAWGDDTYDQSLVPPIFGPKGRVAVGVAAGAFHTVVVTADGQVICWGDFVDGQCEVPTDLPPASDVAAGDYHTMALLPEGFVVCWGNNQYGQCDVPAGIGAPSPSTQPATQIAARGDHSVALLADGSVVCWGRNQYGQCDVPPGLGGSGNPVVEVSTSGEHVAARLADGSVVCWGRNNNGQCDVPNTSGTPRNPVADIAAGAGGNTVAITPFAVKDRSSGTYSDSFRDAVREAADGDELVIRAARAFDDSGVLLVDPNGIRVSLLHPTTIPTGLTIRVGINMVFENEGPDASLSLAGQLIANTGDQTFLDSIDIVGGGRFIQNDADIYVTNDFEVSGGRAFLSGQISPATLRTAGDGEVRVAGDVDAFCDYDNAGTTIVQRGVLYIYGDLSNTGTLVGDVNNGFLPPEPGDGLSIGGDYLVGAAASISLPDPVWRLAVGGDLDIAIDDPSRFTMGLATLELTGLGSGGVQFVEATSADLGSVESAFTDGNNLIGEFRLRAGTTVELVDAHDNVPGNKSCEVIYTDRLVVPAGATLVTSGCPVHVREAIIDGSVSDPADIVVLGSAPPCPADLDGDGQVGGSDLGTLFSQWGGPGSADLDGDGLVGGSDLGAVFAAWGDCPE